MTEERQFASTSVNIRGNIVHFPRRHQVIEGAVIVSIVSFLTSLAFLVSHFT